MTSYLKSFHSFPQPHTKNLFTQTAISTLYPRHQVVEESLHHFEPQPPQPSILRPMSYLSIDSMAPGTVYSASCPGASYSSCTDALQHLRHRCCKLIMYKLRKFTAFIPFQYVLDAVICSGPYDIELHLRPPYILIMMFQPWFKFLWCDSHSLLDPFPHRARRRTSILIGASVH